MVLFRLVIAQGVSRLFVPFALNILGLDFGHLERYLDIFLTNLFCLLLQGLLCLLPLTPLDKQFDLLMPGLKACLVEHAGKEEVHRGRLDL